MHHKLTSALSDSHQPGRKGMIPGRVQEAGILGGRGGWRDRLVVGLNRCSYCKNSGSYTLRCSLKMFTPTTKMLKNTLLGMVSPCFV